jgi:hypothetical protein
VSSAVSRRVDAIECAPPSASDIINIENREYNDYNGDGQNEDSDHEARKAIDLGMEPTRG